MIHFDSIFLKSDFYEFPEPREVMNGCFKSWSAVHLSLGFFLKQQLKKSVSGAEKPLIFGGSSLAILYIALREGRPRFGGCPSHN